jgi:4-aminobutyrate aminotransferase-like enzyme
LIGDVRGKGFFMGLELVKDRSTLEPAVAEAGRVRDAMRDQGVLVATSGPLDNLIKIRPPLVFSRDNADLLLEILEQAFAHV